MPRTVPCIYLVGIIGVFSDICLSQVSLVSLVTSPFDQPDPQVDMFTLTCTSTGGPATNVTWTVDGSPVPDDGDYSFSQIVVNPVTGEYSNTLTVTGMKSGDYQCTVSNIHGTAISPIFKGTGEPVNIINIRLQLCVRPCVTEGQRKSVDPESKASASLDRATRRLREGGRRRRSRRHYLRVRALGRWARGKGARWRSTLTCVPRWLAKGPVPREAIGCGGSVEPGDCVPGFLRAEVSGEKRQER